MISYRIWARGVFHNRNSWISTWTQEDCLQYLWERFWIGRNIEYPQENGT